MASLLTCKSRIPSPSAVSRIPQERGSRRCAAVLPFRCNLRGDSAGSRGREEPLEKLFAKELKRRGIDSISSLSETSQDAEDSYTSIVQQMDFDVDGLRARDSRQQNRARSSSLNTKHLRGLVPKAKVIVTTGVTIFVGFWPLILLTIGIFSAMDHYFGPAFVHRAHHVEVSRPPRVGPTDV